MPYDTDNAVSRRVGGERQERAYTLILNGLRIHGTRGEMRVYRHSGMSAWDRVSRLFRVARLGQPPDLERSLVA